MPELGRFFNVDPLAESYLHNSPYAFSENKVVAHVEIEGLEAAHYTLKGDPSVKFEPGEVFMGSDHIQYNVPSGAIPIGSTETPISEAGQNLVNELTDFFMAFTPFDEVNTLYTGETPNGKKAESGDYVDAAVEILMLNVKGGKSGKGPSKTGKPKRPYMRKKTVDEAWELNMNSDGKVIDPTGVEIKWDKSKPRNGQWDMGHKPGKEFRKDWELYRQGKLSWEDLKTMYNDSGRYRPELPSTNRSHKYEEGGSGNTNSNTNNQGS